MYMFFATTAAATMALPPIGLNGTAPSNDPVSSQQGICGAGATQAVAWASTAGTILAFALLLAFAIPDKIKAHWGIKLGLLVAAAMAWVIDSTLDGLALECAEAAVFNAKAVKHAFMVATKLAACYLAFMALEKELDNRPRTGLPLPAVARRRSTPLHEGWLLCKAPRP